MIVCFYEVFIDFWLNPNFELAIEIAQPD